MYVPRRNLGLRRTFLDILNGFFNTERIFKLSIKDMTKVKEIIFLSPPRMPRGEAEECFESEGYECPECCGNGYYWGQDADSMEPCKQTCTVCGGSGEVRVEVTVKWKGRKGGL